MPLRASCVLPGGSLARAVVPPISVDWYVAARHAAEAAVRGRLRRRTRSIARRTRPLHAVGVPLHAVRGQLHAVGVPLPAQPTPRPGSA